MAEVLENPVEEIVSTGCDIPPIFGKCPNCKKPLYPRDKNTNQPKAPPVNQGKLSRAKCDGCHSIIEYIGGGEWVVFNG